LTIKCIKSGIKIKLVTYTVNERGDIMKISRNKIKLSKKAFIDKYYDMFDVYHQCGIDFDELVAELMLKEGIMDIAEYHDYMEGLERNVVFNSNLDKFNAKFGAILELMNTNSCSVKQGLEAMTLFIKYFDKDTN